MAADGHPLDVERAPVRFLPFQNTAQDRQEHKNILFSQQTPQGGTPLHLPDPCSGYGTRSRAQEISSPGQEEESVVMFAKIRTKIRL